MSRMKITTKGFRALQTAVKRHPGLVQSKGVTLINRGVMVYRRIIEGKPWRVNQKGGGVPVATGKLKRSHNYNKRKNGGLTGIIDFDHNPSPSDSQQPYGAIVHGDSARQKKMKGMNLYTRPWLNYAVKKGEPRVKKLYMDFLDDIVNNLAS